MGAGRLTRSGRHPGRAIQPGVSGRGAPVGCNALAGGAYFLSKTTHIVAVPAGEEAGAAGTIECSR